MPAHDAPETFSLSIDLAGDALTDDGAQYELARILRRLVDRIESDDLAGVDALALCDVNGNTRGTVELR